MPIIRGYVFKLGFLDGKEGFMLAVSNAEGSYYRYLKLIELTNLEDEDLPSLRADLDSNQQLDS